MNADLVEKLLYDFNNGSITALGKLITRVENRQPGWMKIMKQIFPCTGNALIIGITGPPGAGKSTLTNVIASELAGKGYGIGIIAVDPTSPFSGGALLGDRLRMAPTLELENVFVRSMATRGVLGGLSRSVGDAASLMDAFGKDVIIMETVGVGQDEIEVIHATDLVILVCVPGMGDSIQAIKAGIMEIADIFVVNKADREGADQVVADLKSMIEMQCHTDGPGPEIFKTVAVRGDGVFRVAEHAVKLGNQNKQHADAAKRRISNQIKTLARQKINSWMEASWSHNGDLEMAVRRVMKKESDPYSVVEEMLAPVKGMFTKEKQHD
jgi:LAO/AO transport system kinase